MIDRSVGCLIVAASRKRLTEMRLPLPIGRARPLRIRNGVAGEVQSASLHECAGVANLTAAEIIEEIKRLPSAEQFKVVEFARRVAEGRQLSPEELGELAKRMAEAEDPVEADRLQEEIVRGFYGGEPHA
jgi:hypothetical protein